MKTWLTTLTVVTLLGAPLTAQSFGAFASRPSSEFTVRGFSDQEVAALTATLDRLLAAAPVGAGWRDKAGDALWQFARRIQSGRLTRAQETRILAHLDGIVRARPEAEALLAGPRKMITLLTPGKIAPEIVGRDLEGRPFRLTEYRNKVVLLVFTAEWCAICRAQAPYERFLLDKYARWPFAILGVETGSSREAARQAQLASPLSHRAWWDEPRAIDQGGPIAAAWNVIGWPATYLIDGEGVIQFVDVREESLLMAVRQMVEAQADRDLKAKK